MFFGDYILEEGYDEYFDRQLNPRDNVTPIIKYFNSFNGAHIKQIKKEVDLSLKASGITFNLHHENNARQRVFPFDVLPRILDYYEWQVIQQGLSQRIMALDCFLYDIYHDEHILNDGVVPREFVYKHPDYHAVYRSFTPKLNRYIHISGPDLIRHQDGEFYVLEDNCRCPSGVSYVLKNRLILKQCMPDFFSQMKIGSVARYSFELSNMLRSLAPEVDNPVIVLLTPGVYNCAYFEHCYLAQQLGLHLAQGCDLVVKSDHVYLKTVEGLEKVDVIYRRVNDEYLDPKVFRKDSCLGVSGLMDVLAKGNVSICNAPGCGIADDKALYRYVPKIIEYYLQQQPILRNIPTYQFNKQEEAQYILNSLDNMVVKPTRLSGGYDVNIGPFYGSKRDDLLSKVQRCPDDYIAQPKMNLSSAPVIVGGKPVSRHLDLRPFVLYGEKPFVLSGGLSRVAMQQGSLVVNSSQGGGMKDTWVVSE